MGKLQGDGLPDPVYYTKEVDGEALWRPAYTPTDEVNLQAQGWVPAEQQETGDRPAEAEVNPAADAPVDERPGGSRERAQARVVRAPQGGVPADGASSA